MRPAPDDEWRVIESLLPSGWREAAQGWILATLVIALLLENLYHNARAMAPWGYRVHALALVPQ
jgi:hypothetical protein